MLASQAVEVDPPTFPRTRPEVGLTPRDDISDQLVLRYKRNRTSSKRVKVIGHKRFLQFLAYLHPSFDLLPPASCHFAVHFFFFGASKSPRRAW